MFPSDEFHIFVIILCSCLYITRNGSDEVFWKNVILSFNSFSKANPIISSPYRRNFPHKAQNSVVIENNKEKQQTHLWMRWRWLGSLIVGTVFFFQWVLDLQLHLRLLQRRLHFRSQPAIGRIHQLNHHLLWKHERTKRIVRSTNSNKLYSFSKVRWRKEKIDMRIQNRRSMAKASILTEFPDQYQSLWKP